MAKTENGRPSVDMGSIRTLNSSHIEDESSLGSDSEINGFTSERQADRYGFIGGAQQYSEESAQDVPPEVLRQRELKWLDMLSHWDKWMIKRFNKVRLRCQKGIPPALRGRAWLYLSGGKVKREQNQGKFQELDSQPGDPKWLDVIEKDLHRQFPFHEMFVSRGGHGQQDLFRVLKAYTLYRPEEGYCQAQAPIAAVLLMHMPAEDAFWGLVQICEKYLPGYYSPGLEAIQLDGEILFALLRRVSPISFRHLEKHKIDPVLYMTEWFMCAFSRTLPWASVLRVWDMFLCDGVKIIFRVGLVLLKCTLGTREKLKTCQGLYETMELLRAIDPRYMQEGFLVREILEVPVTARDVEREHHTQVKRWRKNRGELNFKPAPRMHGARIIMLAEPPRRQDLKQNPTIVLEVPEPPQKLNKGKEERKSKKKKSIKKPPAIEEVPNPYPLPTDLSPPSTDLSPPSTDLSPLSTDLSPPSTDLSPPSTDLSPPSTDLSPPSTDLSPPSTDLSPPSTDLSPPSTDLSPPSTDLSPPSTDLPVPFIDPPVPFIDPPVPPPDGSVTPEASPETETNSNHQQSAPPTDLPAAKESALQESTQSLSSSEQDTYL